MDHYLKSDLSNWPSLRIEKSKANQKDFLDTFTMEPTINPIELSTWLELINIATQMADDESDDTNIPSECWIQEILGFEVGKQWNMKLSSSPIIVNPRDIL